MNNTTNFTEYNQWSSVGSSIFTISNFTCTGKVIKDLQIRANNYFIMISGYIEFDSVKISSTGTVTVSMPFNTPNKNISSSTVINFLINRTPNGLMNIGSTAIYPNKLNFILYDSTTIAISYYVFYFCGTIFKYA